MRERDVAIVGGGLSGLAAAAFAARDGLSVLVLERAGALGGRAQTQDEGGFLLNLGPHALYCGGEAMAAMKALGLRVAGGVPSGAGAYALRRGSKHTLPVGAFSLMTSGLLPLAGKLEAGRVLAGLRRLRTEAYDQVSESEWLASEVRNEGVRELLGALLRLSTYANDPDRQSAGAALAQLQLGSQAGVLYVDGGWQTLVEGLRGVATRAGSPTTTHCRVEAIEPNRRGGFDLHMAEGDTVAARTVIVATPPREAARLLRSAAPHIQAWADAAIPVRAACLDLALDRLPRPEATFALGIDEPLYASVHTRAARLAPDGGVVLQLARYLGSEPAPDTVAVERQLEDLAERLQPGFRGCLRKRRFLPDLLVSSALVRADLGGLRGRRGPAVDGAPGLFVAGDWVGPRGMLADAALASAREAARLAVEYLRGRRRAA